MTILRRIAFWLIVLFAVNVAGWMVFDGVHALVTGDYVTPKSGDYAGQLGPWSNVVSAIGIEPRSTLMKLVFIIYGCAWLAITVCFIVSRPWAPTGMLLMAIGSLWYLVIGTAFSALQIILLLCIRRRAGSRV